jgi:hypothetical protein
LQYRFGDSAGIDGAGDNITQGTSHNPEPVLPLPLEVTQELMGMSEEGRDSLMDVDNDYVRSSTLPDTTDTLPESPAQAEKPSASAKWTQRNTKLLTLGGCVGYLW